MSIDIIGTIHTPGEYDELGAVIVAPEPLPGWHVITTAKLSGLDAYLSLASPPRVFAGAKTHYYVFESEGQARELIGTDEEGNLAPKFEDKSLEDLLAAKLEAVNEGKNKALDGGFRFTIGEGEGAREVIFDSDSKARLAYLELATKLGQDPAYATPWKASRGQWVTMDAALFADLQPAYEAHIQACFAWQGAREQELAAAYAAGDRATMESVAETM